MFWEMMKCPNSFGIVMAIPFSQLLIFARLEMTGCDLLKALSQCQTNVLIMPVYLLKNTNYDCKKLKTGLAGCMMILSMIMFSDRKRG